MCMFGCSNVLPVAQLLQYLAYLQRGLLRGHHGIQEVRFLHSFKSAICNKGPTVNLKAVLAKMETTRTGKCSFTAESQVFVDLTEATATVDYILTVVPCQWGQEITLVSADGIEMKHSPGSLGKVPFKRANGSRDIRFMRCECAHVCTCLRVCMCVLLYFHCDYEDAPLHVTDCRDLPYRFLWHCLTYFCYIA